MKIKIKRSELLNGLACIQGIIERKTTMPILSNALIEVTNKNIQISATDLEVGIISIIKGDGLETGRTTISAKSLYDIARELPEGDVNITVDANNRMMIICGKSDYKLNGVAADEFPSIPVKGDGDVWQFSSKSIVEMIEKSSFAMSNDETRFNLNGIYFDPVGEKGANKVRAVATDGHRLSIVEREVVNCNLKHGVIIPRKGVSELKKLVEGEEIPVDLWIDEKNLIAYKGANTIVIRLIEGQFPPYEQIVPKQSKKVITVKRDDFIHTLKRASVLAIDRSMGVRLSISSKGIEIFSQNPDLGEVYEEMDVQYKGESFEVGFNARYLIDALSVIDDEMAVLQLGDETSPLVLKSEKDLGFTHVIMPMRL